MNTVSPSDLGEFCSIAFQQLPVGMAFVDSNGRIEQLNQALADLTGITFDELIGRRFGDLFEPGPAAEAISLIERFAGDVDLETKSFELPLRRPDRSSLTVALTLTPIRDAGGHAQHIVALLDDVTRERAAETALRTEKERFRLAIGVGRFEIWDYNPNTEIVVIKGHQEDETVTGLPAGRAAEWLAERFHPDDLREANAMFQRGLHGAGAVSGPVSHTARRRVELCDGRWPGICRRKWRIQQIDHNRRHRDGGVDRGPKSLARRPTAIESGDQSGGYGGLGVQPRNA